MSEILLMVDPGIGCHIMALSHSCARYHRLELGVGARYDHSPLLVNEG